jgi:serine/threonine protein kinase
LIFQVADIVKYLHSEGWVYRDLKASNLIIGSEGIVKLVDLGFAKKIGTEKTDSVLGTYHAMPVDLFCEGGYGYSVDFFGLGILCYEFVVGRPPFGFLSSWEEIKSKYGQNFIDSDAKIQDSGLRNFLTIMLETDWQERCCDWDQVLGNKFFKEIWTFLGVGLEQWLTMTEAQRSDTLRSNRDKFGFNHYSEDIESLGLYKEDLLRTLSGEKDPRLKDDPFAFL